MLVSVRRQSGEQKKGLRNTLKKTYQLGCRCIYPGELSGRPHAYASMGMKGRMAHYMRYNLALGK